MAKSSFGGTVKLTGESEYRKALSAITSNLKVLNSEMKVVSSQYDKNDKSTKSLSAQKEVLNKKLAEQKQKVDVLGKALADSEKETGKNSETTKKWQIQLNEARAEVNRTEQSLKGLGDEADRTGQKTIGLGDIIKANLISDAIKSGLKAVANGVKAIGTAFVNVGKQAIASYGEYEQLVGGVETLFKGSADKVQEYASIAYKTAGLSANKYMETVTSFSASLISSLAGDTEKASEIANMAIIDMGDNANKMGTDMQSIQNAYQGFAKQNWTMLDNLKLGYGGTAREMARLVNESGVLGEATIDLNDKTNLNARLQEVGYAKIIEAVHRVQQEMGITGTTALEASGTITGSVGSMKSAWANLVTGIADDNANFELLITNFVESIVGKGGEGGVLSNILPRIQIALDGVAKLVVGLTDSLLPQIMQIGIELIGKLVEGISNNLPTLLESASTILNTLIDGIVTAFPALVPAVLQMIETFIGAILDNLPLIFQTAISMIITLAEGIADALPELIPAVVDCFLTIIETLLDNVDLIVDAAIAIIEGLAEGIINALPILIKKVPIIIIKFVAAIIKNLPRLIKAVFQAVTDIISEEVSLIFTTIGQWLASIWEAISQWFAGIWETVSQWFSGIWTNIGEFFSNIFGNIGEFFSNIFASIGEFFSNMWASIKEFLDRPGYYIGYAIGYIARLVVDFFTVTIPEWFNNLVQTLADFFTNAGEKIKTFFTETIPEKFKEFKENLAQFITDIGDKIKEFFTVTIPEKWRDLIKSIGGFIGDVVQAIVDFFTVTIPQKWQDFKDDAKEKIKGIGDWFKELPENLKKIGKDMIEGLWKGIKDTWDNLKKKIGDFGKGIVDGFKKTFNINSPSKVFKEQIGKNLALGIGEGFTDTMAGVSDEMQSAVPTDFDMAVNTSYGGNRSAGGFNETAMFAAFKKALTEVKVVMNNREMGAFVENTIERAVYS